MFETARCPAGHAVAWLEGDRKRARRNLILKGGEFPRTLTTEVRGADGMAATQVWVRVKIEAGEGIYRPMGGAR
jgi:hypothetical protein